MSLAKGGGGQAESIRKKIKNGELPADYFVQRAKKAAETRKANMDALKSLKDQVTPK